MAYTMEASELIARFGDCVEEHAATVLVGAGLSKEMGYPDWSGLLQRVREELGLSDMGDLPLCAQYYIHTHSDPELQALIRAELGRVSEPIPSHCHRLLAALPLSEIWTTNYDNLIERSIGDSARVYVDDQDLALTKTGSGCRVYKMHGSLDHEERPLVIARDHYIKYPDTHQRFWALLQASFLTKSFLFIGFGFEDPNFDQVFGIVRRRSYHTPRPHFALMRKPKERQAMRLFDLRLSDLQGVGIKVATIEDYREIPTLLKQLVARCQPSRLFVSGSSTGIRPVVSDNSYPAIDLSRELEEFADLLGSAFAKTPTAVSAGGKFGARVGYQLLRRLQQTDEYKPNRFILMRRQMDKHLDPPSRRYGSIVFQGSEAKEMRTAALVQARGVLSVGGDPGVAAEIEQAKELGLGVVPVGKFGGSSLEEWTRISNDFGNYRLGGLPVARDDFNLLRHGSPTECAEAAVRLAQQALYYRKGE